MFVYIMDSWLRKIERLKIFWYPKKKRKAETSDFSEKQYL